MIALRFACRRACQAHLCALRHQPGDSAGLQEAISVLPLLTAVGDWLAPDEECPVGLLEFAVELAERLPREGSACRCACHGAAEAIGDLIDARYLES